MMFSFFGTMVRLHLREQSNRYSNPHVCTSQGVGIIYLLGGGGGEGSEIDGNDARHALYHRYTVHNIDGFHRFFVVCNDDELRILGEVPYNVVELCNIGII